MMAINELTNREQEVVHLLLAGKSNKEIAAALVVSERTVEFHLQNIYQKFQVTSRVELVLKLRPSTVADTEKLVDNSSMPVSAGWVATLKATAAKINKEFAMESLSSTPMSAPPLPLTFYQAIRRCLTHYAEFTGRASRPEFWWFALFVLLVTTAFTYVSEALGSMFTVAMLLPFLAVGTRRLHDTGKSGWWQLLLLAPVGGLVALIILWAMPGTAQAADEASAAS